MNTCLALSFRKFAQETVRRCARNLKLTCFTSVSLKTENLLNCDDSKQDRHLGPAVCLSAVLGREIKISEVPEKLLYFIKGCFMKQSPPENLIFTYYIFRQYYKVWFYTPIILPPPRFWGKFTPHAPLWGLLFWFSFYKKRYNFI